MNPDSLTVPSVLGARGLAAGHEALLGWVLLLVAAAVTIGVTGLLVAGVWRGRSTEVTPPRSSRPRLGWIVGGGVVAPSLILIAVFVLTIRTQASLAMPGSPELTIQVTGHRWWWEVHYLDSTPSEIASTANELHLPVGKTVRLELITDDVIHSLWIPQLAGKTDLVPGQRNTMWIQADSTGIYRGQCAEYCGSQHGKMALAVVAESPGTFDTWLAQQREPALVPVDPAITAGREAFGSSACPLCHTVRGTPAGGRAGPDLTHLASRLTLAAGVLPNTRGHLAGWVANPQAIKPGTLMPVIPLSPSELLAVVGYLESLK